jgi:hypothetical protein
MIIVMLAIIVVLIVESIIMEKHLVRIEDKLKQLDSIENRLVVQGVVERR